MAAKKLKDLWAQLEYAVAQEDNEVAHSVYDEIIHILAKEKHPKLVNKLDKLVNKLDKLTKDTAFWCA